MLILHHYDMSPFSEKIRLMCGYSGVDCQSVISPESPPRPIVDPLTGGYRRIPVAQFGADIFCDTRLISSELSCMGNKPELDPSADSEENAALAARAEGELFFAAIASIPATRILRKLFKELPFTQALRFLKDRAGVARTAIQKPAGPKQAVVMFQKHLEHVEQLLARGGDYLAGDAPTHADFATVHTLWFQLEVGGLPMPKGMPHIERWYARMMAYGDGSITPGTIDDALAAARDNEPREIPDSMRVHEKIGEQMAIRPNDYALDATSGTLVGASASRYILARDAGGLGTLHVHFPSRGFCLE